jgi:hypothetical protein
MHTLLGSNSSRENLEKRSWLIDYRWQCSPQSLTGSRQSILFRKAYLTQKKLQLTWRHATRNKNHGSGLGHRKRRSCGLCYRCGGLERLLSRGPCRRRQHGQANHQQVPAKIFASPADKIMHNAQYDLGWIRRMGFDRKRTHNRYHDDCGFD